MRHLLASRRRTTVLTIIDAMVGRRRRCLGSVVAGQIGLIRRRDGETRFARRLQACVDA